LGTFTQILKSTSRGLVTLSLTLHLVNYYRFSSFREIPRNTTEQRTNWCSLLHASCVTVETLLLFHKSLHCFAFKAMENNEHLNYHYHKKRQTV